MTPSITLGILTDYAGVAPRQLTAVSEEVEKINGLKEVLATRSLKLGLKDTLYIIETDLRTIVRNVDRVIACPRQMTTPNQKQGVWDAIRFAKHRKLPLVVVMPSGDIYEGVNVK